MYTRWPEKAEPQRCGLGRLLLLVLHAGEWTQEPHRGTAEQKAAEEVQPEVDCGKALDVHDVD